MVRRGRVNREYYRSETPAGSWDRQRGRPRQKGGKWKTSRSHTPQWETNEPTKQTPAKNQPTPAPATPTAKEAPTQPDQPMPKAKRTFNVRKIATDADPRRTITHVGTNRKCILEFLYKISYPNPPDYIKSPIANLPQLFVLLFCACKNDAFVAT